MNLFFFIIFIIVLISSIVFSIHIYKTWLNPCVVLLSVFILTLNFSLIITDDFIFSSKTLLVLIIGLLSFYIASILTKMMINKSYKLENTFNIKMIKVLFYLSLFINIIFLIYRFNFIFRIANYNIYNLIMNSMEIRRSLTSGTHNVELGILGKLFRYILNLGKLAFPLSIFLLFFKKKKYWMFFALFLDLMISILHFERSFFINSFFWGFFTYLYLYLLYNNRFKFKFFLKVFLIIMIVFLIILIPYKVRHPDFSFQEVTNKTFKYFGVANLSLDKILEQNVNDYQYGTHTFYGVYKWLYRAGITNKEPQLHLDFVRINLKEGIEKYNTYTYLYYFLIDFGILGVIVLNILLGVIFSISHILVFNKKKIELILIHSYLMGGLVWFFASFKFKNTDTILILLICTIVGRIIVRK